MVAAAEAAAVLVIELLSCSVLTTTIDHTTIADQVISSKFVHALLARAEAATAATTTTSATHTNHQLNIPCSHSPPLARSQWRGGEVSERASQRAVAGKVHL